MDKRIEKTKRSIQNAFVDLLTEKGDKRITVTEIAKKANIGRKTFYLHYTCIEDIVKDIENDLESELYRRTLAFFNHNQKGESARIFFDFNQIIKENLTLFQKISTTNYYFMFKNLCIQVIRSTVELILKEKYGIYGEELDFYVEFYSSGIGSIYASYFQSKSKMDLNQLAEVAINSCFVGLNTFSPKK